MATWCMSRTREQMSDHAVANPLTNMIAFVMFELNDQSCNQIEWQSFAKIDSFSWLTSLLLKLIDQDVCWNWVTSLVLELPVMCLNWVTTFEWPVFCSNWVTSCMDWLNHCAWIEWPVLYTIWVTSQLLGMSDQSCVLIEWPVMCLNRVTSFVHTLGDQLLRLIGHGVWLAWRIF